MATTAGTRLGGWVFTPSPWTPATTHRRKLNLRSFPSDFGNLLGPGGPWGVGATIHMATRYCILLQRWRFGDHGRHLWICLDQVLQVRLYQQATNTLSEAAKCKPLVRWDCAIFGEMILCTQTISMKERDPGFPLLISNSPQNEPSGYEWRLCCM